MMKIKENQTAWINGDLEAIKQMSEHTPLNIAIAAELKQKEILLFLLGKIPQVLSNALVGMSDESKEYLFELVEQDEALKTTIADSLWESVSISDQQSIENYLRVGDVSRGDEYLLEQAADQENATLCQFLIDAGADPVGIDNDFLKQFLPEESKEDNLTKMLMTYQMDIIKKCLPNTGFDKESSITNHIEGDLLVQLCQEKIKEIEDYSDFSHQALNIIARFYDEKRDVRLAKFYELAIAKGDLHALHNLQTYYKKEDDNKNYVKWLSFDVEKNNCFKAMYNLGWYYASKKEHHNKIKYFKMTIDTVSEITEPSNQALQFKAAALYGLGRHHQAVTKDYELMMQFYDKFLETTPEDYLLKDYNANLGKYYLDIKDYDQMRKHFTKAIEMGSKESKKVFEQFEHEYQEHKETLSHLVDRYTLDAVKKMLSEI